MSQVKEIKPHFPGGEELPDPNKNTRLVLQLAGWAAIACSLAGGVYALFGARSQHEN